MYVSSIIANSTLKIFTLISILILGLFAHNPLYAETLHHAATRGNIYNIKHLLQKGVDVNKTAGSRRTALHLASLWGKTANVKFLVQNNADLELPDKYGYTALRLAAQEGQYKTVKALIRLGANVNSVDSAKDTILHYPKLRPEIAKLLLEARANIEAKDGNGYTPLMTSAQAGNIGLVNLLLIKGASIDAARDKSNAGLLHWAVIKVQKRMVKLLLSYNADVNIRDENLNTPLHDAARFSSFAIVKILVARGANVNAVNNKLETPLHRAASGDNKKIVLWLLKNKADPEVKNKSGQTALEVAIKGGFTDLVVLLKPYSGQNTPIDTTFDDKPETKTAEKKKTESKQVKSSEKKQAQGKPEPAIPVISTRKQSPNIKLKTDDALNNKAVVTKPESVTSNSGREVAPKNNIKSSSDKKSIVTKNKRPTDKNNRAEDSFVF